MRARAKAKWEHSPEISFAVEPWASYYPECKSLWIEHYNEFAPAHEHKMEMGPDVELYQALDKAGKLLIVVARDRGQMIGYCLVVVKEHLHYCKTLCAFEDSYFVSKPWRRGFTGVKLFKETLRHCTLWGAKRAYFMTKEFNSIEKIFLRLGMKKIDTLYSIWLGA